MTRFCLIIKDFSYWNKKFFESTSQWELRRKADSWIVSHPSCSLLGAWAGSCWPQIRQQRDVNDHEREKRCPVKNLGDEVLAKLASCPLLVVYVRVSGERVHGAAACRCWRRFAATRPFDSAPATASRTCSWCPRRHIWFDLSVEKSIVWSMNPRNLFSFFWLAISMVESGSLQLRLLKPALIEVALPHFEPSLHS